MFGVTVGERLLKPMSRMALLGVKFLAFELLSVFNTLREKKSDAESGRRENRRRRGSSLETLGYFLLHRNSNARRIVHWTVVFFWHKHPQKSARNPVCRRDERWRQ
jgi:hypothetical protein